MDILRSPHRGLRVPHVHIAPGSRSGPPGRPGAAVVLAAALLFLVSGRLPGQGLLNATASDGIRGDPLSGSCRAMPAWLSVDGPVGAATLARDGRRAVVGFTRNPGGPGGGRTALRVVDLPTGRPLVTAELGDYGRVTDVWPSHEGTRVWLAAEEGGRVLTVDSRTGKLLMMWEIGRTSVQSGAVSRGDRFLYVTNREAGSLTLIDRTTVGARTVQLERGVGSLDVSELGPRSVWVANPLRDELVAVSGRSGEILARMYSGGRGPVHVRARPGSDEIWVAHAGSAELVIVDGREREVVGRIPLASRPDRVAFSDDGSEAFVSLPAGDRVVQVDPESRRVVGPAPTELAPASLGAAGCGLAHLVASGACRDRSIDPWTGSDGLPVGWVSDEEVVTGRLCPAREQGSAAATSAALTDEDPEPAGEARRAR